MPSAAAQALASFGFTKALDFQLLAGGPEAAELMTVLRTGTGLSIAARAKIRLLVGDREHLARIVLVSQEERALLPKRAVSFAADSFT